MFPDIKFSVLAIKFFERLTRATEFTEQKYQNPITYKTIHLGGFLR